MRPLAQALLLEEAFSLEPDLLCPLRDRRGDAVRRRDLDLDRRRDLDVERRPVLDLRGDADRRHRPRGDADTRGDPLRMDAERGR